MRRSKRDQRNDFWPRWAKDLPLQSPCCLFQGWESKAQWETRCSRLYSWQQELLRWLTITQEGRLSLRISRDRDAHLMDKVLENWRKLGRDRLSNLKELLEKSVSYSCMGENSRPICLWFSLVKFDLILQFLPKIYYKDTRCVAI